MDDCISKYGINFLRVKEEHLELIRNWRNSDYVREKMIFRDIISPEMQHEWFKKINNNNNFYFIVEYKNEYVGVANIKDVFGVSGEPGFFLADQKYEDTDIAARASLGMAYIAFSLLQLENLYIHVLRNNKRALSYNLFTGFKIKEDKSTDEVAYLELNKGERNKKLEIIEQYLNSKTI